VADDPSPGWTWTQVRRPPPYGCFVVQEDSERRLARALVWAQVGLLGAQVLLRSRRDWTPPPLVSLAAGLTGAAGLSVLAAAGLSLGRGLTASPLPNEHAELRTAGLYRAVRHPIYSGVIAMSLARTVASGDRRQAALSAALVSLLYGKSTFEERALAQRFPDYPQYAARTPRFVPRVSAARCDGHGRG